MAMTTDEFFAEAKRLNLRVLGTPEEIRAALDLKDAEIARLKTALLELVEQEYPVSSWNAEHIDYEISMGNGAAPLVKRVRELLRAQSTPQPADVRADQPLSES